MWFLALRKNIRLSGKLSLRRLQAQAERLRKRQMDGFFTLDDLRLVRAIGAAGTLTGAARQLRLDHSTAFRRLGTVEKRLGARLFERARAGYTPTPAGEAALATATRILEELGEPERHLAGE